MITPKTPEPLVYSEDYTKNYINKSIPGLTGPVGPVGATGPLGFAGSSGSGIIYKHQVFPSTTSGNSTNIRMTTRGEILTDPDTNLLITGCKGMQVIAESIYRLFLIEGSVVLDLSDGKLYHVTGVSFSNMQSTGKDEPELTAHLEQIVNVKSYRCWDTINTILINYSTSSGLIDKPQPGNPETAEAKSIYEIFEKNLKLPENKNNDSKQEFKDSNRNIGKLENSPPC